MPQKSANSVVADDGAGPDWNCLAACSIRVDSTQSLQAEAPRPRPQLAADAPTGEFNGCPTASTADVTLGGPNQLAQPTPKIVTSAASAAERKRRQRERERAKALMFERDDWALFLDLSTLPQKAGCQPTELPR